MRTTLSRRLLFRFLFPSLALLCAFAPGALTAQPSGIRFDRITTENVLRVKGLSQNTIQCMMQDSKGFIWIGTWDGLNRYDGYDFTIFNIENGLTNSTIHSVVEDKTGRLWVATDDGLTQMDWRGQQFVTYQSDRKDPNSISSNRVNHILLDSRGVLWLSTSRGLNQYRMETGTFSATNFFSGKAGQERTNWITMAIEDRKGKLWIGTYYGLHCYDPGSETFLEYYFNEIPGRRENYLSNTIQCLMEDNEGNIWAGTLDGIFVLNAETGDYTHFSMTPGCTACLGSNTVNALYQDHSGLVWVGTDRNLNIYDPATGQFQKYHSSSSTTSLSNDDIRCIFEGADGTIWVGTYKGLNKADFNSSRFTHYHHLADDPNSLSDNIVYAILEDRRGLVWIGTYQGVNILDRTTESFTFLTHDPGNPGSVSSNRIRTLTEDRMGYIWVGTETSGLNRFDPATGLFKKYLHDPYDPGSLAENNILTLLEDSKGRLWVGTGKGVSIMQPGTGIFRTLSRDEGSPRLCGNLVWSIYEDHSGNIWIGTTEGLNRLDPELARVTYFLHDQNDPATLSSNRVFSIYEDREGIFWIGTMGGGLNRFDPASGTFRSYKESNGLPNNVVYATIEDGDGKLWITTNWGMSKFDKLTGTFVNYDALDGLQSNEFNAGAYFRNGQGEIYVGGMNGFNVFHPSDIKMNHNIPRIAFTGFKIFNEPKDFIPEDGDTIRLGYSDSFFTFEFSALDYTNPAKNWYRYRMEGYDPEWIMCGPSRRFAEFQKVTPGTYLFKVTGSNNDGLWNPDGISVTVIIRPPWWQTWVFRVLFVAAVISVAWGLIYWRMKYIRRKHEMEKKMLSIEKQVFELEQKALRLQMNPHFIFNSLNAIQNFVITNDTDKAVNYLAKFSHLMRMILANSIQSYIPLKDELKALTYYMDLEKLRFDDKFDYTVDLDASIDTSFIEVPPMLLQPYVENAIIHGLMHLESKGSLVVGIRKKKDALLCYVQDNGIGREKAIQLREQSGIKRQPRGMMITQERLEILKKQRKKTFSVKVIDLKNDKGEATGTRVEITIQFKEIRE